MTALLSLSSRRYLAHHPALMLLSALGVALGVSVVVAIDLTNASAERAFTLSADAVAGQATHALVGGPSGVPESLFVTLKTRLGIADAAPLLEGHARSQAHPAEVFTLLGVDLLTEAPFRPYLSAGPQVDLRAFWTKPGAVLLSAPLAERLGVKTGDSLPVEVEGVPASLPVVGVLTPQDARSRSALDALAIVDLSTAQELLRRPGVLSRIDLKLRSGDDARIRSLLPAGVTLQSAGARAGTLAQMTSAFRTNLTALSLLALFVGLFLIYNAATFSVVQRRPLFGRLRALGVDRPELFRRVLGESIVLASVGTGLGLLGGWALARGLLGLVTRTVNDLYFVVSVRNLTPSPIPFLKGAALGLGGTVVAALLPAWDAARSTVAFTLQRSNVESDARRRAPPLALAGLLLAAAGGALLRFSDRALLPGYLGLFALLLGAALIIPSLLVLLSRPLAPVLGAFTGLLGRMAARSVGSNLSRTGVAVSALTIAMATSVGIGVMVRSFRETVVAWLDTTLQQDIYISPPSDVFRRGNATLLPAVAEALTHLPGVADWSSVRVVTVETDHGEVDLVAPRFPAEHRPPYTFLATSAETAWAQLAALDTLAVSEPFAFHRRVARGDVLRLHTDSGERAFRIVDVYRDYGSDTGSLLMARPTYDAHFHDPGVSGISLRLTPNPSGAAPTDAAMEAVMQRAREAASGKQLVSVRSNRSLRTASLEVFDRTFTITRVLQLLALGVALVGVVSALLALQLERARELAVLRALGLTPGQLWGLATLQTGALGLFSGLLSVPLGILLASVLVHVINRRSFGWTLTLALPLDLFVQAALLSLLAALLAGLYPAWRMARTPPSQALREE